MLNHNEMVELLVHAAKRTAPTNFTVEAVDATVVEELQKLGGSIISFMKNRYDIYAYFAEAADEIVPNKVMDAFGIFAETRVIGQGQKALFKRGRLGKNRAKSFLTRVGLSGVYETFRLDTDVYEVPAYAQGGAGTVDFERVLDGAESIAEVMQILTDELVDSIYVEVQKALMNSINAVGRPVNNKVYTAGFDASLMLKLINTARSYGSGAVIFAAPEFVEAMGADAIVPVPASGNYGGVYHPQDIDMIHNQGYINIFRGTPIVRFAQSYIDETNTKTWINPQNAYVFPTGAQKVVKIVLEGNTQVYDWVNKDQSIEINMYRKIGVGIESYHNWGVYVNTAITNDSIFPTVTPTGANTTYLHQ